MNDFTTVRTEHPHCLACDVEAKNAAIMARVTGSRRSSHGDGIGHRATVIRN